MGSHDRGKAWSDFRVGLLTFAGLGFLIFGITLAGGDKGLLFHKTTLVKAELADVGGLKKGSSVTMGGMTIGRVTEIGFVEGGKNQIAVTMEVRSDVRSRIKADSVPSVRTMGMLGDRYIDISAGTEAAGELPEASALIGEAAGDFDKTLRQATDVMSESEKLVLELRELVKDFQKNPRKYVKFSLF